MSMNATVTDEAQTGVATRAWPRGTVRRETDGWHISIKDYDPIRGYLRTDHVESTWDRAWAWLDGLRRVLA
ncbi:hypothetical protein [Phytoactinopolyspora endophytica]|uniref:hypothetical protein n=1 Tax=Phytoactinopolyspora endophytica TaxID=1642495 RepID=UPI00101CEE03|nr:hypothetical protein [Phytoactinopolyspora endophytica]